MIPRIILLDTWQVEPSHLLSYWHSSWQTGMIKMLWRGQRDKRVVVSILGHSRDGSDFDCTWNGIPHSSECRVDGLLSRP